MSGTAEIVHGNALDLPIPDATVDLIVTSPPYFGLRSYQDGGEHYDGQIGDEATPAEFVDALIAATREMVRVLKPSGSIWVNLGDKYASNTNGTTGHRAHSRDLGATRARRGDSLGGIPTKSLIGIPWRYALRCIDDLGLILRAEVIWSKPNGLPESVTDRVRRSHETWFHFTKQPRYFSAVDEVREPYEPDSAERRVKCGHASMGAGYAAGNRNDAARGGPMGFADAANANPLGKLPGSVWTIPTQPLRVPAHLGIDHFAAFPMEWPRRIIRGWSPSGVCVECGEGRRPVSTTGAPGLDLDWRERQRLARGAGGAAAYSDRSSLGTPASVRERTITGYACACPAPDVERTITEFDHAADRMVTRTVRAPDPTWTPDAPTTPAVVLDPFGGTGTTALVAKVEGRRGISVDLSRDYCRLAQWRTNDPGELARAMQVEKPPAVMDDQGDLLEMLA